MNRTTAASRALNKHGTGKDGFTDGDPGVTSPTVVDTSIMDPLQEEIANAVEVGGDGSLYTDCLRQLSALLRRNTFGPAFISQTPAGAYAGTFQGAAYGVPIGVNRYLLVGTGAEIQTSPLGVTWTNRTPGSSFAGDFYGALASQLVSLFVICGDTGEIQTSADGITWTRRNTGGAQLRGLAESGSILVASGSGGRLMSSTDGITWTDRTAAGGSTANWNTVAWNGSVFVVAGTNGEIQTSSDGITWAAQTAITSGADNHSISADAQTGRIVAVNASTTLFTSDDDGASFSTATPVYDVGSDSYKRIWCFDGLWVILSEQDQLLTSIDGGATWHLHMAPGHSAQASCCAYGPGATRRLLIGAGATIYTSRRG